MTEPEEDFAALFEASLKAKRFERGQTIEGIVVSIGPAVAFVDVGGKGEASIDIEELRDPDGSLEVAVGDRIQAVVVSTSGGLTLSRKLARGAATLQQLEDVHVIVPRRARHADLAGAVARRVRIEVAAGDLGGLGSGGRCGEFGMQHPTVTGEAAASPRIGHDRL